MLWGIRPVELQAAYGLAVEGLRRQVHLGLIRAGERLMPERQLAETLGVSRVTLREALRVLQAEGYVTVRRGVAGGAFVVDEDTLRDLAARRFARDPATLMRVVEFLAVNERMAARLAALRRTPGDLKRLHDATDLIAAAETAGALRQAETMFRMALAQASQNGLLVKAIEEALTAAFFPLASGIIDDLRPTLQQARTALTAAVSDRNAQLAEDTVSDILEADWRRARTVARLPPAVIMEGRSAKPTAA